MDLIEQLIEQDRFPEAKIRGESLLATRPASADLYALLAHVELNLGRLAVARQYMLEALRLDPESAAALQNLAYLDSLEIRTTDGDYIRRWLVWRARQRDFPRVIHLETVGRCNAKCSFCPHPQLERKFDAMSDELFAKILHEARGFPVDRFDGFAMHAVNEPFMDRKIFDRLAAINAQVPHAGIQINTNMNVMPPRFFERIRGIRRINSWNVSLNAANRSDYEKAMQIDFARTVSNIRALLHENRESRFIEGPVSLSRVATNDGHDALFASACEELFTDFTRGHDYDTVVLGRANWLDNIDGAAPSFYHAYPCHQWVSLTIHCNGIVPHCCVDGKEEFPFGDINRQSILDTYNNPHWRNLRENASSRDTVFPCKTCNLR